MIDYSNLLYAPNYLVHGVPAVLTVSETFGSVDLTVIDKTTGVASMDNDVGAGVHIVRPHCTVMMSELAEKEVNIAELDGSIIVFNSVTYRVESHAFLPSPSGQADGQLAMILIEAS